jgi:hypothetical protein
MRHRAKSGQNRMECPVTGLVASSGDFRMRWDGVMVHKSALDPRHPQEEIEFVPETAIPEFSYPPSEQEVDYTGIGYMAVDNSFVVSPYDKETQPVEWELWYNTTYTDLILGKIRGD